MSFDALGIGASGVRAAQKSVDVTGHNIANVNTPGYTRQRTDQAATISGRGTPGGASMRGTGVTITNVARLRSATADIAWRSQASVTAKASAAADILASAESVLGDIDASLPTAVNQFNTSLADLAVTPADQGARAAVMTSGQQIVHDLNSIGGQLSDLADRTVNQASELAGQVNVYSRQVATLNDSISRALVAGNEPNDLLDSRDEALDKLAQLIGARPTQPDATGSVDVYIGGQPLVRGIIADPVTVATVAGTPQVQLPNGATAKVGGQIGGLLETAAVTLPGIVAKFDTWTSDFTTSFNAAHAAGYGTDGVSGRPFFTGTTAVGIALDPSLSTATVAAAATANPNDGNNALALAGLGDVRDAAGRTSGDRLRTVFTQVGLVSQQAQVTKDTQDATSDDLNSARLAEHSVSVDEEMVDLVRYQRAYEASARVVSVADQLLDTLINRTGRS